MCRRWSRFRSAHGLRVASCPAVGGKAAEEAVRAPGSDYLARLRAGDDSLEIGVFAGRRPAICAFGGALGAALFFFGLFLPA